jgi:hypothetical protein
VRGLNLGDHVVVNLWFRGSVIDTCTNTVRWQDEWHLRTRGRVDLDMSFPYLESRYTWEKVY